VDFVPQQNKLTKYREKRDFTKTAEPSGEMGIAASERRRFVIQKHDATRLDAFGSGSGKGADLGGADEHRQRFGTAGGRLSQHQRSPGAIGRVRLASCLG
jgi:hypothetical protein